ncbi:DNA-3-methyladenine glycosylase 2 family protein [Flavobacterium sp. Fl-77]|uniref:DNA-3-methyladenine glycosylase II n=1 Tax=Flavobacterium flavipigmentatum TaxID=2893884 RepID=A0AAJ2VX86_9FLAO|nr:MULTISPECIES: DNA-3-methyladenine glycosylase 2 family protein [unclassified Flavobacterium]MDX6181363.1 DNA-3-methyladenine glycosylase 2 family protein [Flavobacterium sp. Fl-33]MDX6184965.1 DNA-3-methyladenine glycosylase 2 family protein [Flavobacterium sp. Fl-77]UFH40057.1 DNA-3-methyladenine glycosylase 2 family protein [Flavobacterium sp. F-70]
MQEAIDYLTSKNPIFLEIIKKYGLPQIPKRPQGFETLVLLILEQQVSVDSAKATFLKIKSHTVCNPETLSILPDEEFRILGVSRQKTQYIKILAEAILSKKLDIESLAVKSAEEVRKELIQLKGIGNWTIDIYLMFCLQEPDLIPLGDIAVVNTIKELLDIHDKKEMEIHAQQWSPHRSYATYLLWHYYLSKRNRKITY